MPAKRKKIYKKNGAASDLFNELWNAAVALRGSIEPADYKRYVLPLIFLRFLSLRYEQRVAEIKAEIANPQSDLFTRDEQLAREILEDPDNFIKKNVFLVPKEARWDATAMRPKPQKCWWSFVACAVTASAAMLITPSVWDAL
jgi:type I restriction-modification system DNA methylase subunit